MEVKKQEKPGSLSPVKGLRKDDDGKTSRSNSKSERDLRLQEKPPSEDAARRERRPSRASESSKDTLERQESKSLSPKVSRKYFTNWKQACDKTKDKTKELLKRWRTLPEAETSEHMQEPSISEEDKHHGWSKEKENEVLTEEDDSKIKEEVVASTSTDNIKRTRTSNVKEEGFYNYKKMVTRNLNSQEQGVVVKAKKQRKKSSKTKKSKQIPVKPQT
ncbi:hypothetical protein RR48_07733 [Papilio machaon]|uniref:Uncharacterized protein n=1 Tax=Papilio machaon TaxID=76193 RepID=A0A194QZ42_PAPMA|nr:hypothetical protein RR48_07733 [Papilio machaon]